MAIVRKKGAKKKVKSKTKKQDTSDVTVYKLPTQKSKPSTSLQDYIMLIYGEKKVGKTTLASLFGRSIFLMFESGAKAISVYQRPCKTWKDFKGYVKALKKDRSFQTVVIDPVDNAYNLCLKYVCKALAIDHPSDEDWGKGWQAVKDEWMGEILELAMSGKGIIFISHATEKKIKTRSGETYDKIMPTMSGQARETIEGMVDIWAYYYYDGEVRKLDISGDDHVGAGHRLKGRFLYTDGTPIKEIPMGESEEEAYENFMKSFNNELKKEVKKATVSKKKRKLKKLFRKK